MKHYNSYITAGARVHRIFSVNPFIILDSVASSTEQLDWSSSFNESYDRSHHFCTKQFVVHGYEYTATYSS